MFEFFSLLFDGTGFPPRWSCGSWSEGHGWLHVISDLLIFGAYLAIPIVLIHFVTKRKDIPFHRVFLLFAGFILFCGTGHLLEAVIFWNPIYRLAGIVKLGTAMVSWGTVIALVSVVPRALSFKSPQALEREVEARTRALEQQRAVNEHYASIVESSTNAIVGMDLLGKITSWNGAAERIYGFSAEEVIGRNINMLSWDSLDLFFESAMQQLKKGERIESLETDRKTKEQEQIQVEITFSPVYDSSGALIGASEIGLDITAKKRAEGLFHLVVEAAPSGMVAVDQSGEIVLVNAKAESLFGYERAEMLGGSLGMLLPKELGEAHSKLLDAYVRNPEVRAMGAGRALRGRRKDGSTFPVEVGLNPIEKDGERLVLSSILDRTELVKKQEALEARTRELQRANEEREQFVYAVSHDLKAPLVTATGFLAVLKDELAEENEKGAEDSLQRLERAHTRMTRLIDELLYLSRIGRRPPTPEWLDTQQRARDILEEYEGMISQGGFQVEVAEMPKVLADPNQFDRALQNLVINSLKHGRRKEGQSRLEIGGEQREGEVLVYVRDDGPGVPSEHRKAIFRAFERLQSDSSGSGIGLAVVQNVMQNHRGRAWVESDGRSGATFWLAFPGAES